MPESMSLDLRRLLKRLAPRIFLTPAANGMPAPVKRPMNPASTTPFLHAAAIQNPPEPGHPTQDTAEENLGSTDRRQGDILASGVGNRRPRSRLRRSDQGSEAERED